MKGLVLKQKLDPGDLSKRDRNGVNEDSDPPRIETLVVVSTQQRSLHPSERLQLPRLNSQANIQPVRPPDAQSV